MTQNKGTLIKVREALLRYRDEEICDTSIAEEALTKLDAWILEVRSSGGATDAEYHKTVFNLVKEAVRGGDDG